MKKIFLLLFIFIFITLPNYANQNSDKTDTLLYLNLNWWACYNDDILTEHLKNVFENNYDIKNADLKVKENEKLVKIQLANELPSLSFDGFISRDFRSSIQRFGDMAIPSFAQNNFQLPLTMSYEVDIWGKNRLKTKMNKEQLEIAKQAQRAAYISLTSDFAAQYFNLIKADKLISIQTSLINIQNNIVSKVQDKFDAGLCSIDELLNEQKLLTLLKEEKNNLIENQEILINILKVYLSNTDEDILRTSFDDINIPKNIPLEIDSNIIVNRPDYIIQEANIRKMGYDVKIAKKELLPNFIIFGQLGLNAYRLNNLFNTTSQLANAGIMPSFDLFSGGRKIAFLQFKKLQYEEAINNYHKTILEDIKEVNLGLFGYKTALKNYNESVERLQTQHKLYKLTEEKNKTGAASILDTLYAQENDLLVQKEEIINKINCIIASISLYKSIGGKDLYQITEYI